MSHHTNIQHRRTHNLLLISKLFNQRDTASPFTLAFDSLEQPAKPLIREYIRRANLAKTNTVFLGFETANPPAGVDHFIPCYDKTPTQISQAVSSAIQHSPAKRHLLLIDTLHPLCTASLRPTTTPHPLDLSNYLTSLLLLHPSATTLAIYHNDVPIPLPPPSNPYTPSPLTLLTYLATTILTLHSLAHLLARAHARARSQQPPLAGLPAALPGLLVSLPSPSASGSSSSDGAAAGGGLAIELEHRRKSGRGVHEWYFLPTDTATDTPTTVTLLDDHPLFRRGDKGEGDDRGEAQQVTTTFSLELTQRQRLEREGVVLPYFDAQMTTMEGGGGGGGGRPGEGGRILYDMGEEDDFDEEEDEI